MPRGIPRTKQDESAMRFTSFHVPLPANPKNMGTTYLKSDSQTLWARNAAKIHAANRNRALGDDISMLPPTEGRRGSKVLVIHPGTRWIRIGRASDVTPLSVPNVIARKHRPPVPPLRYVEGVSRPRKDRERGQVSTVAQAGDEYSVLQASDDPFDNKVAAIQISLRDRMRFYKLRVTTNAANIATTFNEQFTPETIPESNDPFRVDWVSSAEEEHIVGEKALRLSDPEAQGYFLRWPISGGNFNTRDYSSRQFVLNDVETIIGDTLREKLNITPNIYKDYSVVLVIPDFYDRNYVENMCQILLRSMGFKQLCVQQESLAATYGAGISNGCVVDMGAATTSIACVDDGLVIPDTRMFLNMGGDAITEFLYVLLQKINFPYRDLNLARSYDWNVMEDLKARLCTLAEGDVALNLYDFVVRRPGQRTEKYGLRAYDEIILAPMCLFEPRVIEFEQKRTDTRGFSSPDVTDEIVEQIGDHITQAMMISTQHLIPSSNPTHDAPPILQASDSQAGSTNGALLDDKPLHPDSTDATSETASETNKGDVTPIPSTTITTAVGDGSADAPMEIVDADDADARPTVTNSTAEPSASHSTSQAHARTYPGGFSIDVCFEASKLPLDVAIFNSARAAGGDEKIRKYLQGVLVVGGCALVPGMAHALESRLQAIATPLVPNMEKVQIIPPPKDVDPRVLVWKGAAVLGKMDGVAELWITPEDWDIFGIRGLKERCFYL
ncbi:actin-like ATPase domain-containing protein [Trametopsis cervina]|nr:actin-like ATPase domain-containing protein [Trametopsis cervina]